MVRNGDNDMSRHATCYFALAYGLNGCYMPDSDYGSYAVTKRRDMLSVMREALEFYEFPKNSMNHISWRRLWRQTVNSGTSSVHFSIGNVNGAGVQFMGLTESEYNERNQDD